ncbi:MAG TPA: DUF3341 domain-containing protein [Acetobacteraceae bacterium]|jgi:hypothetical protein|nr:DUF3341 domain-containing protein [Acetobacteraceae bacterium]
MAPPPLFGIAASFDNAEALLAATEAACRARLGRVDAYTPVPVPGLTAALGLARPPLPVTTLIGVLIGGFGFFGMAAYATIADYPLNVGGRPLFSWPAYVIPSVSIGALWGAVAMALTLVVLNRLPQLNHPMFHVPGFERATQDRFFLSIEASGEHFDADAARRLLLHLPTPPLSIDAVPR